MNINAFEKKPILNNFKGNNRCHRIILISTGCNLPLYPYSVTSDGLFTPVFYIAARNDRTQKYS